MGLNNLAFLIPTTPGALILWAVGIFIIWRLWSNKKDGKKTTKDN